MANTNTPEFENHLDHRSNIKRFLEMGHTVKKNNKLSLIKSSMSTQKHNCIEVVFSTERNQAWRQEVRLMKRMWESLVY